MSKSGFWISALPYSKRVRRYAGCATAAVFLLLLLQTACFDPKESCLDIAATNFNAAADKNCCCKYPDLVLSVEQRYDTLVFRQDSFYTGTGGHRFQIKSIVFYLSDFQLFKSGASYEMGDSSELKIFDAASNDTITRLFTDDFTLVRRVPIQNEVAAFREDGFFDKIRFRLGLDTEAGKVIPALAPANHPLRPQPENLYRNGYVFLQAIVTRDTMAGTLPDTLNFTRNDLGDFFVEGSGNFEHKIGYDFPMTLEADWKTLFEGVNWNIYDIAAWKMQIVANLPSVFSVYQ